MDTLTNKIRTSDAIRQFGTASAVARALGITPQAVDLWGEFVPELRAYQLRERFPEKFPLSAA